MRPSIKFDFFKDLYITNSEGVKIPIRVESINNDYNLCYPEFRASLIYQMAQYPDGEKIKDVIFNDPATIVLWRDGTKTVVKCQEGDTYDKEKGLALCIAKKYLGNKGNFNEVFKKWIPEDREPVVDTKIDTDLIESASKALKNLGQSIAKAFS